MRFNGEDRRAGVSNVSFTWEVALEAQRSVHSQRVCYLPTMDTRAWGVQGLIFHVFISTRSNHLFFF